jgi:WD40 repeat protein
VCISMAVIAGMYSLLIGGAPAHEPSTCVQSFDVKSSIVCVLFLTDDLLILGGGDPFGPGEVILLNRKTGARKKLPGNHKRAVWALCLDQGRYGLLSGGGGGQIIYRKLKGPAEVFEMDAEAIYTSRIVRIRDNVYAWAGDNLVSRESGGVIFDVKQKKKVCNIKRFNNPGIPQLFYCEEKKWLVMEDDPDIRCVDPESGIILRSIDTKQKSRSCLAYYKKKALMLSFACKLFPDDPPDSQSVAVFDFKAGELKQKAAYDDAPVIAAAVSEDDGLVFTGNNRGILRVLRAHDLKTVLSFRGHGKVDAFTNGAPIRSLAISPDGRWLASCGDDDKIKIFDLERVRKLAK